MNGAEKEKTGGKPPEIQAGKFRRQPERKAKNELENPLFQLELGQNGGNWPSLNLGRKKCFPRTGGRGKENYK